MRIARLVNWIEARRARDVAALFCLAAMVVAVNVVATRFTAVRLDLTAERLYTLSNTTRQTLAAIDEPITLRLYTSAAFEAAQPAYGLYARRVRELLGEYVAAAAGKLRLELHDPPPLSPDAAQAAAFGLQPVFAGASREPAYFGLAGTNATDDRQIIALFTPQRDRVLEYDITRLVLGLNAREVPDGASALATLERRGARPRLLRVAKPAQRAAILVSDIAVLPIAVVMAGLLLRRRQPLSDAGPAA